MRWPLLLSLAWLGAACAQPGEPPTPSNDTEAAPEAARPGGEPGLYLAVNGVEIVDPATGRVQLIPFGAGEARARPAIERITGSHIAGLHSDECRLQPNDRFEYRGGLFLYFEGGRFVAWQQDDDGGSLYRIRSGIAPGMTRDALARSGQVQFRQLNITPGIMEEFRAGAVTGTVDNGRVVNFHAGTDICLAG